MIVGVVGVTTAFFMPSVASTLVVAFLPVEDVGVGDRVGLDAADLGRVVVHHARVRPNARDDLCRRRCCDGVACGCDERRVPVLGGHDVVGDDLLLDRLAVRRLHPVRERRDERDERDADHERGRGRGRPRRVADRVAAREPPRRASAAVCAGMPDHRPRSASRASTRASRRRGTAGARRPAMEISLSPGPELVGEHRACQQRAPRPTMTSPATQGDEAMEAASAEASRLRARPRSVERASRGSPGRARRGA